MSMRVGLGAVPSNFTMPVTDPEAVACAATVVVRPSQSPATSEVKRAATANGTYDLFMSLPPSVWSSPLCRGTAITRAKALGDFSAYAALKGRSSTVVQTFVSFSARCKAVPYPIGFGRHCCFSAYPKPIYEVRTTQSVLGSGAGALP